MTVPDGGTSVTSGPLFTSGTQVSVDAFLVVTATTIAWDADAQTITMDSDKEVTLTMTETGPAVSFWFKKRLRFFLTMLFHPCTHSSQRSFFTALGARFSPRSFVTALPYLRVSSSPWMTHHMFC